MDLKKKIEEMSAEFAKMLKETLEKMQERINLAQWDNDNDPSMIKKMKEMNNINWSVYLLVNRREKEEEESIKRSFNLRLSN